MVQGNTFDAAIVSPQGKKKKKEKKKIPFEICSWDITDSDLGMFQARFSFRGSGGELIPF